MSIRQQELWRHDCEKYVRFPIDLSMNGNHVLNCPNCGHEHCRVVKDGVITDIRWDSRNGPTINVSAANVSYYNVSITASCTSSGQVFLAQAWGDTTGGGW